MSLLGRQLMVDDSGLFCQLGFCFLSDVVVNEDAAAMFADDNFFVHLDFGLALGRNLAETASTSVTVDSDYGQSVACAVADALVGLKITRLNELLLLLFL